MPTQVAFPPCRRVRGFESPNIEASQLDSVHHAIWLWFSPHYEGNCPLCGPIPGTASRNGNKLAFPYVTIYHLWRQGSPHGRDLDYKLIPCHLKTDNLLMSSHLLYCESDQSIVLSLVRRLSFLPSPSLVFCPSPFISYSDSHK